MESTTKELAAFLRAKYARLEPHRPLLAAITARCRHELRTRYGIDAKPHDLLAAAEDFMLAILDLGALTMPESTLLPALQAHVMAQCLGSEAGDAPPPDEDERWNKVVADAMLAVDSVLVRATAVAAEELRRVHAIFVPPVDVLITVNDVLHDFAAHDDGTKLSEYQLERRMVDHTVSVFLAARATLLASRRR